ncbi:MAG: hypothetical protein WEA04_02100 [Candidatus Andersenbacteria bacterium]
MDLRIAAIGGTLLTLALLVTGAVVVPAYLRGQVVIPTAAGARVPVDQALVVQFTTSSQFPAVRIEICRDSFDAPNDCVLLARRVDGSNTAVFIPATYPIGKAIIRVTNITTDEIAGLVQYQQQIVVVR